MIIELVFFLSSYSTSSRANTASKSCSYADLTSFHPSHSGVVSRNLSGRSADGLDEQALESRRAGTDELVGLLAVDKDLEGGHGADAELLGELGEVVDVDLGEEDVLELLVVGVPVVKKKERVRMNVVFRQDG